MSKECPNCKRSAGECASEGSQDCWRARCAKAEDALRASALLGVKNYPAALAALGSELMIFLQGDGSSLAGVRGASERIGVTELHRAVEEIVNCHRRHQEQSAPPHEDTVESVVIRDEPRDGISMLEQWFVGALHTYREAQFKPFAPTLPLKYQILGANLGWLLTLARRAVEPLPIAALYCPVCKQRHIDDGEFTIRVHHTHACQAWVTDDGKRRRCGHVWRPALQPTVGVEALPGFINDEKSDAPG